MQENVARTPAAAGAVGARARSLLARAGPYLLFGAVFAFGWRAWNILHALPYYEDVLEVTWATNWYDGALRGLHGFAVDPLVFFPTGWQVATFGEGPAMFLLLLPLNRLAGAAFAYNVTLFLTFLIAFAGAHRLAVRFLTQLPATIAALLFAFWGFRWYGYVGHLNILLASAMMPWTILALQNALRSPQGRLAWLAVTGLLWALMVACSWYFAWVGGLLVAGWLAGVAWGDRPPWRTLLLCLLVPALVCVVLMAPLAYWFLRATNAANATFYELPQISLWDASINSFPIPSVGHPWFGSLARWLYRGPANEPGQTNFGLLAFVLALLGTGLAWRSRTWRPVLVITGLGLLLALGLALKWDGQAVQWPLMRPLDSLVWQVGHRLKPDVFVPAQPPAPFDAAVPLPGLLLSALLPWWDRARVFARYALLASAGFFMLAALTLPRVRWAWARYALAALLVIEVLPAPTGNNPFPLQPHPAFAYLAQQPLGQGEGIVDLGAWQPSLAYLPIGGATLWAADFHGKPTVAGASSVWPAHVAFLDKWLASHPDPFQNPDLIPLLRFYGVRYILFHVSGGPAQDLLQEARSNPGIHDIRCFDPASSNGPWNYPMCIMELATGPQFSNLMSREGWSGQEPWGRWIEGTQARAEWVATVNGPQKLTFEAFPVCLPGRRQSLSVLVNGVEVSRHEWAGCESWSGEVVVPAELARIGLNDLILRSDFAARPPDQGDSRALSVGFNRLNIAPAR